MKNDLCICCNLFLAHLEIELCQASAAYVKTGRIAYLYTLTRLEYDKPHVALEHRTKSFRMCSSLFSRYCVWGNQSNLQSSKIPRYFIFEMTFSPHSAILEWLLYNSVSYKHWHQCRFVFRNLKPVFFAPILYGSECIYHRCENSWVGVALNH